MKQLTSLQTGLAYDRVLKDIDRRELRSGGVEANWKNYIEIARSLLAVSEVSRMGVAEIATRATILRHGGDRHSLNWKSVGSRLTVKAFSNEIGVKPATLWLWIKIKTKVFDQLSEKDRKKFKHDAGEKTYKAIGSKKNVPSGDVKLIYGQLSTMSIEQRAAFRAIRSIMAVRKVFRKYYKYLSTDQVSSIKVSLLEILKIIEDSRIGGTDE